MKTRQIINFIAFLFITCHVDAQEMQLTLTEAIALARDSSLSAKNANQSYLKDYWEYRIYQADRRPNLTLTLIPGQYNRSIIQRYDSESNQDFFRTQQSYYASGGLSLVQNVDFTGGKFYINANLDYLQNIGSDSQFSAIPFRIGYSQSLVGYNPFKWDKLIMPLKHNKSQQEFIYNMEQISENAISYYFALASAQSEYNLAVNNLAACDTLYKIGCERYKIAMLSKADLNTLELEVLNANNHLKNCELSLHRAIFQLASYLNISRDKVLRIQIPEIPNHRTISITEAIEYARSNNPAFLDYQQRVLESQQQAERAKKERGANISLNTSFGFNQVSSSFYQVWQNPTQQETFILSVSIPLLDWGKKKGEYIVAQSNLMHVKTSTEQEKLALEEEIIMAVTEFNNQCGIMESAKKARDLATSAYEDTEMRFIIGKSDINSLSMALSRKVTAEKNYISSLKNYWLYYYKIRRLTLYDFFSDHPIISTHHFN